MPLPHGRVGRLGARPARQVLPDHDRRSPSARPRNSVVASIRRRHSARAAVRV